MDLAHYYQQSGIALSLNAADHHDLVSHKTPLEEQRELVKKTSDEKDGFFFLPSHFSFVTFTESNYSHVTD